MRVCKQEWLFAALHDVALHFHRRVQDDDSPSESTETSGEGTAAASERGTDGVTSPAQGAQVEGQDTDGSDDASGESVDSDVEDGESGETTEDGASGAVSEDPEDGLPATEPADSTTGSTEPLDSAVGGAEVLNPLDIVLECPA